MTCGRQPGPVSLGLPFPNAGAATVAAHATRIAATAVLRILFSPFPLDLVRNQASIGTKVKRRFAKCRPRYTQSMRAFRLRFRRRHLSRRVARLIASYHVERRAAVSLRRTAA